VPGRVPVVEHQRVPVGDPRNRRASDGRLLLSFVTGAGQPGERQALGLDGARRGDVLEEVLGLVRSWWAGEVLNHRSERWSFDHLAPAARPVQDPLEVWFGGRGPRGA
jgi:alkanesulfonate monooxygenase SsuD/methylene tetrahydromethanopterin reductase-like flavin-dependent oxidoreductase (luciferase family)